MAAAPEQTLRCVETVMMFRPYQSWMMVKSARQRQPFAPPPRWLAATEFGAGAAGLAAAQRLLCTGGE